MFVSHALLLIFEIPTQQTVLPNSIDLLYSTNIWQEDMTEVKDGAV